MRFINRTTELEELKEKEKSYLENANGKKKLMPKKS